MHGFFGSYKKKVTWDLSSFANKAFVKRTHSEGNFQLTQVTLPKFLNDKYFTDIDGCFIATEGVLFEADKQEEAIARYRNGDTTFWNSWRGSFAGVLYDSKTDTLLVFNDHVGSKMLFYTQEGGNILFVSDIKVLASQLKHIKMSESFAWQMLTYGYSPGNDTPIENVHRLLAGQYMYIQHGKIQICTYHHFQDTPNSLSETENICEIENFFRQAVQRVINKNRQYKLQQVAALSAGLDSRISVCIARELTNEPIETVTYSQKGFYDDIIPHEIAQTWCLNMHFTPLDGGDYLRNIDNIISQTGGVISYAGAAQVDVGFHKLHNNTGVILTGMIGDIVINSPWRHSEKPYIGQGAISTTYMEHAKSISEKICHQYPSQALYYLYVRGFNCANLGSPLVLQSLGESYSPFYDVDLLSFCMSIPQELRYNYLMYDKWILRFHPQAAQWLHNGLRKIGEQESKYHIAGREIPAKDILKRIFWYLCKRLHIYNFYREKENQSMNPMDYWYKSNNQLRKDMDDYFYENISALKSSELQQAATRLYTSGSTMEKTQVLTLLSSNKLLVMQ